MSTGTHVNPTAYPEGITQPGEVAGIVHRREDNSGTRCKSDSYCPALDRSKRFKDIENEVTFII